MHYYSVAANKGEGEPERKETRTKVDEDRKHEYPLRYYSLRMCLDVKISVGIDISYNHDISLFLSLSGVLDIVIILHC